jgi:hypothetical protein
MTTKTFPLTRPIKVDGRIGHGTFRVIALDDLDEATVSLTPRTESSTVVEQTTVELRGDTLHITTARSGGIFDLFGGRSRDAIDIEVTVPSGTSIKIGAFTADITVTGRCGDADISSATAGVTAEHVDGNLRLRYGSSECHVERVTGSVQLRSGSGPAQFGEIGGSLSAANGSGNLDVGTVRGAVRVRSGSGGATLGSIHDDVDLACGSGEISIGVPAGISAKLNLTTGSGLVDPQLPVSDSPTNDHTVTIRARTGSGDVHLFRAAA